MSQWVQSRYSKEAEKWKLLQISLAGDDGNQWLVHSPTSATSSYSLPKSEYRLCDPPEVWEDVTEQCEIEDEFGQLVHERISRFAHTSWGHGYRLIKKDGVFRVGRKV